MRQSGVQIEQKIENIERGTTYGACRRGTDHQYLRREGRVRTISPWHTPLALEVGQRLSRDRVDYIIYEKETLRPIGITELRRISYRARTADYGILIGEKDCWSKGYGTETTLLMLDYGFSILGLHNITLETYAYNERAIKAYQRAGFRIMGRRREVNLWGGKFYDEIIMDCLSTEFETPLKRILKLP